MDKIKVGDRVEYIGKISRDMPRRHARGTVIEAKPLDQDWLYPYRMKLDEPVGSWHAILMRADENRKVED